MNQESNIVCHSPVLVAVDYEHRRDALVLADQLDPTQCRLKVGKELFTRYGPEIVRDLQQRGFELFLDMKFHDIPHTVERAVTAAADLGIWMVDVHASGGGRMLEAAKKALLPFGQQAPLLIAITVLTSMDASDLQQIGINATPAEQAQRLAQLTYDCGLDGVVCSAHESRNLKAHFGSQFKLVTPGIRPTGSAAGDQRRVMTPEEAQLAGVDYMVIGRPITQAESPVQALNAILSSLCSGGEHGG